MTYKPLLVKTPLGKFVMVSSWMQQRLTIHLKSFIRFTSAGTPTGFPVGCTLSVHL